MYEESTTWSYHVTCWPLSTTLEHSPAGLRGLKIKASAELCASIGRQALHCSVTDGQAHACFFATVWPCDAHLAIPFVKYSRVWMSVRLDVVSMLNTQFRRFKL